MIGKYAEGDLYTNVSVCSIFYSFYKSSNELGYNRLYFWTALIVGLCGVTKTRGCEACRTINVIEY